jgi:hypothetical protein
MTDRKDKPHDDGRNERQRARDEDARARKERVPDDGRSARQRIAEEQQNPDFAERMAEERKRPDFIERTRPEDPSEPPGEGQIVDPNTLGMPQGGIPPKAPAVQAEAPPQPLVDEGVPSINEPPGSQVQPPPQAPEQQPALDQQPAREQRKPEAATQAPAEEREPREPLPSQTELEAMTRTELDELAEERGLDPDTCGTKAEVIEMLKKDARKRK